MQHITDWIREEFFSTGKNKEEMYSRFNKCKEFFKVNLNKDIDSQSYSRTVRNIYNELFEDNVSEKIEYIDNKLTNMGNVLIVGDIHEPFSKEGYRDFCKEQYDRFNCQTVVFIGDLLDNHAMSYHDHNPDGDSPGTELEKAVNNMKKWYKVFPEAYVCMGNHDRLIERKASTHGLPKKLFKTYKEIITAPNTWHFNLTWDIDNVIYTHGTKSSGQTAYIQRAMQNRKSTVIGHVHHVLATRFMASQDDRIFGMCVGCGIDLHAYAFEYGVDFMNRPVLGCGVTLDNGNDALVIPMKLS